MGIDRAVYLMMGVKASSLNLANEMIDRLRNEEIKGLFWIDQSTWQESESFVGLILHSADANACSDSIGVFDGAELTVASLKATKLLESIGARSPDVQLFSFLAIS